MATMPKRSLSFTWCGQFLWLWFPYDGIQS